MVKTLLVEDDPVIARLVQEILAPLRCDVITVEDFNTARLTLECSDFNLVISDFHLADEEEGDGLDLWKFCQSRSPSTAFVMMSGMEREVFLALVNKEISCPLHFLSKPFTASQCQGVVSSLIQRHAA